MPGLVLVFMFFGKLALPQWATASHITPAALATHFTLSHILPLKPQKRFKILLLLMARLFFLASTIMIINPLRIIL